MNLIKMTPIYLLVVALTTLPTYAITPEQEEVIVNGMFASLRDPSNQSPEQQREILRSIVLFPASESIKQQIMVPELANMALQVDQSDLLRREALKGVVTVTKDKRLNHPYVILLQKNSITIEAVIEAAMFAKDSRFMAAILAVCTHYETDYRLRETATKAFLELWPAQHCDPILQEFKSTAPQNAASVVVPTNPALSSLKREPTVGKTPESIKFLQQIADTTYAKASSDQRLKAQLLLGCLGDRNVIRQLLNRFPSELDEQRLLIAGFFGWYHDKQTVPAIGECSRNDPARTVRTNCLASLIEAASDPDSNAAALAQLKRSYREARSENDRRLVAAMIVTATGGKEMVAYLARRERDKKMRQYLNDLLIRAGKGSAPEVKSPFGETKPPQTQ